MGNEINQFQQLDSWFSHELGKSLLDVAIAGAVDYLKIIFGYHLLQLGGVCSERLLDASQINDKIFLHPKLTSDLHDASVLARFTDLPFLPNSIDLVMLMHTMEYVKRPNKVLNEVYHVLVPDGHVLIIGFNPFSLWGLTKLFSRRSDAPWCGKFIRMSKMRYWLHSVGFKVVDYKTFFYRPPVKHKKTFAKLLFMEGLGQMLWPFGGGVYIMLAKKSVLGVAPVKKSLLIRKKQAVAMPAVKSTSVRVEM